MIRTALLTILTALTTAAPSSAQTTAVDLAVGVRTQAATARKAAQVQVYRRGEKREEQRAEQSETVSRTVKLGSQGEIDLQNMSGIITVTRGGGNDATISAVKRARAATDEEAREMLGLVKIEVAERAGRVEVRTHYTHAETPPARRSMRRNMNVSVAYTIAAPAGTKLRINSMSGDIAVSDITGDLALEAMSGNVKVERGARVQTARTMSGDVWLTDVKSDGVIDAGSMSGSVTLRQVKARRINTSVISGTVTLVDVDCERLEAQTTSGDVLYEGRLAKGGRYHFQSHSGNVKVMLSGDTGFELEANSWGGSVRSELELKNQEQGPPAFGGRTRVGPRNRTLRGTFGDGSAVLDATTFSGTILVTRRVAEKR